MNEDKINLDDLTLGQIRELRSLVTGPARSSSGDDSHWSVGSTYAVRTVTHYTVGRLVKVTAKELVFEHASWVADTGRFAKFMAEGELSECEPFPRSERVIVGRGALVDACVWDHKLPTEAK